jgi:cutinase
VSARRARQSILLFAITAMLLTFFGFAPAQAATGSFNFDCQGASAGFVGSGFPPGHLVRFKDPRTTYGYYGDSFVDSAGNVRTEEFRLRLEPGPSDYGYWPGGPYSFDILVADPSGYSFSVYMTVSGTLPPCGTTSTCRDVLFVGVRGSGEPASQAGGYGDEIVRVASAFTANLPAGRTYRSVALDYTAAPVSTLFRPGGTQAYFDSIDHGVDRLSTLLATEQRNCPNQKVVVAGYSQGALVANLVSRSAPKVSAVLLVADPARVPNQTGVNLGTARSGRGVYNQVDRHIRPLVTSGGALVVQLCDAGDPVCDSRPNSGSLTTHTSYDDNRSSLLREMGRRGAQSVR